MAFNKLIRTGHIIIFRLVQLKWYLPKHIAFPTYFYNGRHFLYLRSLFHWFETRTDFFLFTHAHNDPMYNCACASTPDIPVRTIRTHVILCRHFVYLSLSTIFSNLSEIFSHGQLYVAFSRAWAFSDIYVAIFPTALQGHKCFPQRLTCLKSRVLLNQFTALYNFVKRLKQHVTSVC